MAAFWSAVHGSPEAWNITRASKWARSSSLKTDESSVCSEVMPASAKAACSTGTPCSIASVCRNWVVFVKISTWASPCAPGCATAGDGPIMDIASAAATGIASSRPHRGRRVTFMGCATSLGREELMLS